MRLVGLIFLFFLFSSFSGWSQSLPEEVAEVLKPSKYLLKAKSPSGEVISTTGRIMKSIALSRPQSLEIARIYLNYTAKVKLNTDKFGETTAIISFRGMKLSGDLDYRGFNIENQIFPSLVTFRLILPGIAPGTVTSKQVLATVNDAIVNSGDCSVSIALHKKVTVTPLIDKLAFYHSDEDYKKADDQMKLIDRYIAAGWLMQRTESLLDSMQTFQLHHPADFLASNLEVIVLNDWMTRQYFERYPVFQKNDKLSLGKRMEINLFRKKLIDQDFVKLNVIRNEDLLKAADLFADNLANYFDTSQPDLNRATNLSQMAGSRLSFIGYRAIREFADCYAAVHKYYKPDWRLFVAASTMIRHAMTVQAALLADKEQFSEAMGLLNASENYALIRGNNHTPADNLLIGQLSQRLYNAYLDIALKSMNVGIYSVTNDYYQKAISLKQTFDGKINPDPRERYIADMICKAWLISAEKSFKSNDVESALATFEQVIRLADSARLKNDYETARMRLEAISNRPSGFKPWEGNDLAVTVPSKENVQARDEAIVMVKPVKDNTGVSKANLKTKKQLFTQNQPQIIKDSAFMAAIIRRALANKAKQAVKDSISLANITLRIRRYQFNKTEKDSTALLAAMKKQILTKIKSQNLKDSTLLAANIRKFQAIQLKLSVARKTVGDTLQKQSLVEKSGKAKPDSTAVLASGLPAASSKKRTTPTKILKTDKKLMPAPLVKESIKKKDDSFNISEMRQQISANIKDLHFKVWSGDTVNLAKMLDQADSLQQILNPEGDKEFAPEIKALRMKYDDLRCEQEKAAYLRELNQIRDSLMIKDFALANKKLKMLIAKTYPATCKVDQSEAIRLLSSLKIPMDFQKKKIQLDSITSTEEPEVIIEAFEQLREYYRVNMLDKWGIEPPDLMVVLKSKRETPFLIKAGFQMLNTHRPAFALELLKVIHELEPRPDKTFSLQKRLGEMLASGDHTTERDVKDMLNSYDVNDKWFGELVVAYKKQWKMFSK